MRPHLEVILKPHRSPRTNGYQKTCPDRRPIRPDGSGRVLASGRQGQRLLALSLRLQRRGDMACHDGVVKRENDGLVVMP